LYEHLVYNTLLEGIFQLVLFSWAISLQQEARMEDPSTARCKMQAATNISCRRSPECALTLAALAVWGVRQNMSHQTLLYTDRHALRASIPQLGCSYSTSLRGTGTVICLPTTASHQTSGASAWQSSRTFSTGTPFILGVALGLYGRRYNLSQISGTAPYQQQQPQQTQLQQQQ